MIQIGKTYTLKEMQALLGKDFYFKNKWPKNFNKKNIVTKFSEFDEPTKQIYLKIKEYIKKHNPDIEIKVWATCSRINGTWRTREESELYANQHNQKPKYSDYDFCTDAINLGDLRELSKQLGVMVDNNRGDSNKVLIE